MVSLFIIGGAGIFLLLGAIHGIYTLRDLGDNPRSFIPRDPEMLAAMRKSAVAFHPEINLWRAWLGFNLTHSLGILIFGGALFYIGLFHPSIFSQSPMLQGCSILISAFYLLISLKFFFSKPALGAGLATGCFIIAAVLSDI